MAGVSPVFRAGSLARWRRRGRWLRWGGQLQRIRGFQHNDQVHLQASCSSLQNLSVLPNPPDVWATGLWGLHNPTNPTNGVTTVAKRFDFWTPFLVFWQQTYWTWLANEWQKLVLILTIIPNYRTVCRSILTSVDVPRDILAQGRVFSFRWERPAGGRPASKPLCFSDRGQEARTAPAASWDKISTCLFNIRAKSEKRKLMQISPEVSSKQFVTVEF